MKHYLVVSLILLSGCYNCATENLLFKDDYLYCIIDSLYRDPNNRYSPSIDITNIKPSRYRGLAGDELSGIYKYGEKGDTVIKEAGSMAYKLIKSDTVMVFYPECNGKEIR